MGAMMWLLAVVVVVILAGAWVVGSGKWGSMPEVVDDRPSHLPPRDVDLDATDLRSARFSVVPRGYSMEQVDALLEHLARQLETGDEHPIETVDEPVRAVRAQSVAEDDDLDLTTPSVPTQGSVEG